jgi:hypothetical protein
MLIVSIAERIGAKPRHMWSLSVLRPRDGVKLLVGIAVCLLAIFLLTGRLVAEEPQAASPASPAAAAPAPQADAPAAPAPAAALAPASTNAMGPRE